MPGEIEIYLDDSGSRYPDLKPSDERDELKRKRDCFALGGIMFERENGKAILSRYELFRRKWSIDYPLHSNEIRFQTKKFTWLAGLTESEKKQFFADLDQMIKEQNFVTLACVINRPGYAARYADLYGNQTWMLCKTAFSIVIERAAKFADSRECRLRINFEETGEKEDRSIAKYHKDLKAEGMPFSSPSEKYNPLTAESFSRILVGSPERHKKTSPLCQLADLVLYPMVRGKIDPEYRPYKFFKQIGKLIDCVVDPSEIQTRGIKYSCFDD